MKAGRFSKINSNSDDEDVKLQPQHKFPTKRMTANDFFAATSSSGSSAPNTPANKNKPSHTSPISAPGSNSKVIQPYYVKRNSISHQSAANILGSNIEGQQPAAWNDLPATKEKKRRGSHSSVGSGSDAGTVSSAIIDFESQPEAFDQQIFHELQYPKLRKSNESTYTRKTKPLAAAGSGSSAAATPTAKDAKKGAKRGS